jgi:hypothetical protein
MMSTRTRYLAAVGILIAIGSGAIALLLFGPKSSPGVAPATPQVLVLAASTTSNTITVVGIASAAPTRAR